MTKTNIPNARREDNLMHILSTLDISLPPLGLGRTKDNDERFAVCMLLSTLAKAKELTFPLQLTHHDKPDFQLTSGAETVGIEVTYARNQNQAHFKALMNRSDQQKVYSTNVFSPDRPLSNDETKELLTHEVTGFPLMGDKPYKNWAKYVSRSVREKSNDFNKLEFRKFSKNYLYLVVETPDRICIDDINKAIGFLDEVWPDQIVFDCVYIQHFDCIIKITPRLQNKLATFYVANDIWGFFGQP